MKPNDGDSTTRRVPRHLIDLQNPRPMPRQQNLSTTQVQRWVTSVLISTVLALLAAGMIVSAIYSPRNNHAARIGLSLIAAFIAVGAIGAVRAIHARKVASPWLALGLIVGVLSLYLTSRT